MAELMKLLATLYWRRKRRCRVEREVQLQYPIQAQESPGGSAPKFTHNPPVHQEVGNSTRSM